MATSSSSSLSTEMWASLGDEPNQPSQFNFPKRTFDEKKPIHLSFQSSWLVKWPWIHYDQVNDRPYCFTCTKASKIRKMPTFAYNRSEEAFVSRGYSIWKDASGDRKGTFPCH